MTTNAAKHFQQAFDAEYRRRNGHVNELSCREVVGLEVIEERVLPPVPINYEEPAAGGWTIHESLWGKAKVWRHR